LARLSGVYDWDCSFAVGTPRTPPGRQRVLRGPPLFFWPRCYRLIDQFINSIDFVADEEAVDVADETLGWE